MTLEEKLIKLQEIQQKIEQKTVTLSDSIPLLEEAYKLKKEIEKELQEMENKIITLTEKGEIAEQS
jgi:exodeoxyribonuclease VII small subunit